ncbi:hypothetical protein GIB67_037939 [Kingdonia uniflora]|uniref:Aminotransferase-like plant mobile domain-containing protein n=1 Tax=Kingdonia uniflora TaxID=39325 RepID=A0A7J7LH22_9MAGN|nr:hypothetical protein GIB67_037939 [Kingdonia uniflora]
MDEIIAVLHKSIPTRVICLQPDAEQDLSGGRSFIGLEVRLVIALKGCHQGSHTRCPQQEGRVPTASLRKRLNDEREDLSHPNYNNSPRIPAKRVKTFSTRVLVRDSSISGSVPRVSVAPKEDSSQDSTAVESSSSDSQEEEVLPGDRNFEQGAGEYYPRDPSLLTSFATHRAKVLVLGQWGVAAVKEIFRKSMYLPDRVYPDLKAGGQGISLSLQKIVDFFAGKDKDINKPWSWGAVTLAHLYYSLGASSRVNAKGLACCTTLLESWIFEHFLKLPGIPTPNQSGAAEFCTRWSWTKTTSPQSGSTALNMFREALDSYKLQDVVWDPYLEKREDKHNFKEVASFTVSFTKLCLDVVNLVEDDDYDDGRVLGDRGNVEVPHSQNEGGGGPGEILECESKKKMVEDLQMQLADKENDQLEAEKWKQKYDELNAKFEEAQRRLSEGDRNGVWRVALKSATEGGDFKDIEDPTYEELSRQFTKLLTITQEGPKGEYEDDIILSGRGEYQERIDSKLKKIDHKTNLRQTLFQPFNWFQLDIRDVERDGNTTFRVAASYAYKSQMKFLNVKDSLCTLMTKKPSYWKSVFSQRLDVAYSNLGERRYKTLLRAFKFNGVFVEYLYMGHLLATYYKKVVIFISNKKALTFLPLFWPKANNKITKKKRFENILADSTKYWWVGMTSDKNFMKLKTKYQSPIPPVSTLWWAYVQLDIPDAFVKPCVKNYFDAPNEAWMKLLRDNNVNLRNYSINDLFS